jgi:hypothetical protein
MIIFYFGQMILCTGYFLLDTVMGVYGILQEIFMKKDIFVDYSWCTSIWIFLYFLLILVPIKSAVLVTEQVDFFTNHKIVLV